jgi:hypothetical protein
VRHNLSIFRGIEGFIEKGAAVKKMIGKKPRNKLEKRKVK